MTLLELLPDFYAGSPQTADIQAALQLPLEQLQAVRDDCIRQLDLNTATWGLAIWEEAYGIPVDVSRPSAFRRSRIMAKMRGQGTATKAMIQQMAESYTNGQVELTEHPAEARFEIRFTGSIGIPPNVEDLAAAIEEIKPAHLAYLFIYTYMTHRDLRVYTHQQLAGYTHKEIKEGAMR